MHFCPQSSVSVILFAYYKLSVGFDFAQPALLCVVNGDCVQPTVYVRQLRIDSLIFGYENSIQIVCDRFWRDYYWCDGHRTSNSSYFYF